MIWYYDISAMSHRIFYDPPVDPPGPLSYELVNKEVKNQMEWSDTNLQRSR